MIITKTFETKDSKGYPQILIVNRLDLKKAGIWTEGNTRPRFRDLTENIVTFPNRFTAIHSKVD